MSKLAYQKLIDEAVFQLKCCLNLCTQLFKIETSEESLEIGDYVLVRTPNGCILKPYNTIGIENLTWHDNFNDLNIDRPQPVAADVIAAVRGSQGTKWLPGPLGGTWYPKGYYRSTGAAWEFFGEFSYQASQPDVDAGLITDQFVTPFTLKNAAQWSTKNDSIQFKDEGANLGAPGTVDSLDFVGAGVSASRVGNAVTIAISGSSLPDGDYGDITVSAGGTVMTVDNGLAATVIGDGSVSNTEFQYINSLTGNAQNQLDTKINTDLAIAMAVAL